MDVLTVQSATVPPPEHMKQQKVVAIGNEVKLIKWSNLAGLPFLKFINEWRSDKTKADNKVK
jgi:hypothetical protein